MLFKPQISVTQAIKQLTLNQLDELVIALLAFSQNEDLVTWLKSRDLN